MPDDAALDIDLAPFLAELAAAEHPLAQLCAFTPTSIFSEDDIATCKHVRQWDSGIATLRKCILEWKHN